MKRTITLLLIGIFVILTLIFGVFVHSFISSLDHPTLSQKDTDFVQACGDLNGKELTYENISSLNGLCQVNCSDTKFCGTVEKCEPKHIEQYKKLTAACGEIDINRVHEQFNSDLTNDPYYKCIQDYEAQYPPKSGDLHSARSFGVAEDHLKGPWFCEISTINSRIRAVPHFYWD